MSSVEGEQTTNKLLAEAHAGNDGALQRICHRYQERLSALAEAHLAACPFPIVGVDDAVQSALISFYDRFKRRKCVNVFDRHSLWTLLAVITRRKVLQAIRHEMRLKRGGGRVANLPASPEDDAEAHEPHAREPDPAEEALARDLLDGLFRKLNETNRQIAWLRLAGFTNAEIAQRVGRTEKAVERRLATIREELRSMGEFEDLG